MTPPDRPPRSTEGVVRDGSVVTIAYRMWDAGDGQLLDECGESDALVFLQGASNVVAGLERGLADARVGDSVELTLAPEEAFGRPDPEAVQVVPRAEFPDDAEIEPGMAFGAYTDDDEEIAIFVLEADDESVTVTSNHPLAGLTLRYAIEVLAVREARPEELEHGHPHEGEDHDHD